MDNGRVIRAFFKISQIFWPIGQRVEQNCWLFGVLWDVISAKKIIIVKLFILQKTKLLRYLKGMYIWDWDMILGHKELGI